MYNIRPNSVITFREIWGTGGVGGGCLGGTRWAQRGAKGLPTWSGRREDDEGGLSVGEKITPGRRAGGVEGGHGEVYQVQSSGEQDADRPQPCVI